MLVVFRAEGIGRPVGVGIGLRIRIALLAGEKGHFAKDCVNKDLNDRGSGGGAKPRPSQ